MASDSTGRRRRCRGALLLLVAALSHPSPGAAFPSSFLRRAALLPPPPPSTTTKTTMTSTSLRMNLAGKVVVQRFLYRLSPISDTPPTLYTLEERVRMNVGEDGRTLTPLGRKTFLLRDGPRGPAGDGDGDGDRDGAGPNRARVGPVLHRMSIHETTGEEAQSYAASLGGEVDDAAIAAALYFAAHPRMVRGRVVELAGGVGFGGIFSAIAAGAAHPPPASEVNPDVEEENEQDDEEANDILPTKDEAPPLPPYFESLLLSDSSEEVLNNAYKNTQESGFGAGQLSLGILDWAMPVQREMKNQYDLILGCDVATEFPNVKRIARMVAYMLKANPDFLRGGRGADERPAELDGGHFVHIGPQTREVIHDLRTKLRNGYRMDVNVGLIELERFDLNPLILDSIEEEAAADEKLLTEDDGIVEYKTQSKEKFSTFAARHSPDYDGFNGEYFFPAETGMEGTDAPSSSRWAGDGNDNSGPSDGPQTQAGSWLT